MISDRTTEEILKHILDVPSDIKYPRSDYEEEEEDKEEIIGEILEEEFEEGTSTCQLVRLSLIFHFCCHLYCVYKIIEIYYIVGSR